MAPFETDLSAFWLHPDWGDNLKVPFWTRPPKPEIPRRKARPSPLEMTWGTVRMGGVDMSLAFHDKLENQHG